MMLQRFLNKKPNLIKSKVEDSPFLQHLRWVNPGFLHNGNLFLFEQGLSVVKEGDNIMEVGSFCGLSSNIINYILYKKGVRANFYNIDIWQLYGYDATKNIDGSILSHRGYRDHLINTYKSQVSFFSSHNIPFAYEMYSNDFFDIWHRKEKAQDMFGQVNELGGQFSFIYLDGDHRFEGVKSDFINSDKVLKKGGYILFDDSADGLNVKDDCEVNRFIMEVLKQGKYEVAGKNPNYLLRKL